MEKHVKIHSLILHINGQLSQCHFSFSKSLQSYLDLSQEPVRPGPWSTQWLMVLFSKPLSDGKSQCLNSARDTLYTLPFSECLLSLIMSPKLSTPKQAEPETKKGSRGFLSPLYSLGTLLWSLDRRERFCAGTLSAYLSPFVRNKNN